MGNISNGQNLAVAHLLLLIPLHSHRFDDIINDAKEVTIIGPVDKGFL